MIFQLFSRPQTRVHLNCITCKLGRFKLQMRRQKGGSKSHILILAEKDELPVSFYTRSIVNPEWTLTIPWKCAFVK